MKNLPVPPGPRAPFTLSWLWRVAPFALPIVAYRLIPPEKRAGWNKESTSHNALAAVLAGKSWPAFRHYTMPRFHGRRQPRHYAVAWVLFLWFLVSARNDHNHGVSWAN